LINEGVTEGKRDEVKQKFNNFVRSLIIPQKNY